MRHAVTLLSLLWVLLSCCYYCPIDATTFAPTKKPLTVTIDHSTIRQHASLPTTTNNSALVQQLHRGGGALETRVLSAIVMMGGVGAIIHFGGAIPLIVACQVAMYSEATNVIGILGLTKWWWFLAYFCGFPAKLLFPSISTTVWNLVCLGMAMDGIMALVLKQNQQGVESFGKALGEMAACQMAAMILVGFSSFWITTIQGYGMKWVGYPALLVIINDSMAYFCGILFGRHALLPRISPKKTWEGFLGAAIFTMGLSLPVWKACFHTDGNIQRVLLLAAYVSVVAPFGGFLASIVKRTYGKKDFGSLIPGHGGVVDRLDCQLLVAPFVYLGLKHFGATP